MGQPDQAHMLPSCKVLNCALVGQCFAERVEQGGLGKDSGSGMLTVIHDGPAMPALNIHI